MSKIEKTLQELKKEVADLKAEIIDLEDENDRLEEELNKESLFFTDTPSLLDVELRDTIQELYKKYGPIKLLEHVLRINDT